jgi:hypothetical protein
LAGRKCEGEMGRGKRAKVYEREGGNTGLIIRSRGA